MDPAMGPHSHRLLEDQLWRLPLTMGSFSKGLGQLNLKHKSSFLHLHPFLKYKEIQEKMSLKIDLCKKTEQVFWQREGKMSSLVCVQYSDQAAVGRGRQDSERSGHRHVERTPSGACAEAASLLSACRPADVWPTHGDAPHFHSVILHADGNKPRFPKLALIHQARNKKPCSHFGNLDLKLLLGN